MKARYWFTAGLVGCWLLAAPFTVFASGLAPAEPGGENPLAAMEDLLEKVAASFISAKNSSATSRERTQFELYLAEMGTIGARIQRDVIEAKIPNINISRQVSFIREAFNTPDRIGRAINTVDHEAAIMRLHSDIQMIRYANIYPEPDTPPPAAAPPKVADYDEKELFKILQASRDRIIRDGRDFDGSFGRDTVREYYSTLNSAQKREFRDLSSNLRARNKRLSREQANSQALNRYHGQIRNREDLHDKAEMARILRSRGELPDL